MMKAAVGVETVGGRQQQRHRERGSDTREHADRRAERDAEQSPPPGSPARAQAGIPRPAPQTRSLRPRAHGQGHVEARRRRARAPCSRPRRWRGCARRACCRGRTRRWRRRVRPWARSPRLASTRPAPGTPRQSPSRGRSRPTAPPLRGRAAPPLRRRAAARRGSRRAQGQGHGGGRRRAGRWREAARRVAAGLQARDHADDPRLFRQQELPERGTIGVLVGPAGALRACRATRGWRQVRARGRSARPARRR